MGKKNNKRKQKHSQKMMGDSQISEKEQEALKMGMTMEQYDDYLKMQQQIWDQQAKKNEQEEEKSKEEQDQNAVPKLKPGENFKNFDQPTKNQDMHEESKVAKVQFEISKEDIDPDKLAAKQKVLEMLENESESEQEQDDDIFKNLNQQGSQGQEKSTRAQRELGGEKNQKLAAQIKSDLDRLNQVKKRRELAAKKRQQEKAKKLAQQKKKQLQEMAAK